MRKAWKVKMMMMMVMIMRNEWGRRGFEYVYVDVCWGYGGWWG